jgi:hypothetical protein
MVLLLFCLLSLLYLFALSLLSCRSVTSVYFLQILGGSTHDKEFILKLIMDTVYPVELVPVMVKNVTFYIYWNMYILKAHGF